MTRFAPRWLPPLRRHIFPLGVSATYRPGVRTVERALDLGIEYFFLLGFDWQMLTGLRAAIRSRRESIVIGTGAYNLFWTHQNLRRTLERRLRQLRTDYIDIFHFLGVTRPQHFTARVRDELQQLREDPRVRAVSISCHDHLFAGELIDGDELDAIMIRYNAANRGAENHVFPPAARANAGVVAYTATAWTSLLKPVARGPSDLAVPDAGSCYRFVLSHPAVHVCLTAPRSASELESNVAALERGPLDADELAHMMRFGDMVRQYWTSRGTRRL